ADLPPQYDRSGWEATANRFAAVFASRSRQEWVDRFAGIDACVSPVLSMGESVTDVHLVSRKTFIEIAHIVQPAPAPRFSSTPAASPRPPVEVGQDTESVLRSLGYSDGDISKLRLQKSIR
ncbi:MAG: CoA transferase, partial [Acidimicrobiia bacterium]